jgi:hypothetical protein
MAARGFRSARPAFHAVGPSTKRQLMEAANYEFSAEQNEVIRNLAQKMKFIGIAFVILAVVYFGAGFFPFTQGALAGRYAIGSILSHTIGGALYLALGIFTLKAAKCFRLIVETEDSDIKNLMDALAYLLKNYRIQYWVIVSLLVLLILALSAAFLWFAART